MRLQHEQYPIVQGNFNNGPQTFCSHFLSMVNTHALQLMWTVIKFFFKHSPRVKCSLRRWTKGEFFSKFKPSAVLSVSLSLSFFVTFHPVLCLLPFSPYSAREPVEEAWWDSSSPLLFHACTVFVFPSVCPFLSFPFLLQSRILSLFPTHTHTLTGHIYGSHQPVITEVPT